MSKSFWLVMIVVAVGSLIWSMVIQHYMQETVATEFVISLAVAAILGSAGGALAAVIDNRG